MVAGYEIDFHPAAVDRGPGAGLVRAMCDEIALMYDGLDLDGADMPRAGAAELGPPGGTFLVGWRDGEPVCCGGVKRLDEGTCEIKRMYVTPATRGQGIARRLLDALEDAARALGYAVARLSSGSRQTGAHRLYLSAGYARIGNFSDNPMAAFFAAKPLR